MWTRCVAWAATGMEMTPELFPQTAQLLLLSTTETEGEHWSGPGKGRAQPPLQSVHANRTRSRPPCPLAAPNREVWLGDKVHARATRKITFFSSS